MIVWCYVYVYVYAYVYVYVFFFCNLVGRGVSLTPSPKRSERALSAPCEPLRRLDRVLAPVASSLRLSRMFHPCTNKRKHAPSPCHSCARKSIQTAMLLKLCAGTYSGGLIGWEQTPAEDLGDGGGGSASGGSGGGTGKSEGDGGDDEDGDALELKYRFGAHTGCLKCVAFLKSHDSGLQVCLSLMSTPDRSGSRNLNETWFKLLLHS